MRTFTPRVEGILSSADGLAAEWEHDYIGAEHLLLALLADPDGWKGFDWDAMDRLHQQGLITDPKSKAKSVLLTQAAGNKHENYSNNTSVPTQITEAAPNDVVRLLTAETCYIAHGLMVRKGTEARRLVVMNYRGRWTDPAHGEPLGPATREDA